MKNFLSLSLGVTLALGAALEPTAPVWAAESAAQKVGRAAILAAYKAQDQAILTNDAAKMQTRLAPDVQLFASNGQQLNQAQAQIMLQRTLSGASLGMPLRYTQSKTRVTSLTWRGSDAVVMCETRMIAIARGQGRTFHFEMVNVARDFWSLLPQGWRVRQSVVRQGKIWVNGKRAL